MPFDIKGDLICPKCSSREVYRKPNTGVSPHPGYKCDECGLNMRAAGFGIVYAVVLIICVGLTVMATSPFWSDDMMKGAQPGARVPIVLLVGAPLVALWAAREMFRPTPKRATGRPDEDPD